MFGCPRTPVICHTRPEGLFGPISRALSASSRCGSTAASLRVCAAGVAPECETTAAIASAPATLASLRNLTAGNHPHPPPASSRAIVSHPQQVWWRNGSSHAPAQIALAQNIARTHARCEVIQISEGSMMRYVMVSIRSECATSIALLRSLRQPFRSHRANLTCDHMVTYIPDCGCGVQGAGRPDETATAGHAVSAGWPDARRTRATVGDDSVRRHEASSRPRTRQACGDQAAWTREVPFPERRADPPDPRSMD